MMRRSVSIVGHNKKLGCLLGIFIISGSMDYCNCEVVIDFYWFCRYGIICVCCVDLI